MICTNFLPSQSAGQYLAALGVISILKRTHPETVCVWGKSGLAINLTSQEVLDVVLKVGVENSWSSPLVESVHPLFCNLAHRSLLSHVANARAWIKENIIADELYDVLLPADDEKPVTPKNAKVKLPPKLRIKKDGWWCLGTVIPSVISSGSSNHGNKAFASAWWPALIWEALNLITPGIAIPKDENSPKFIRCPFYSKLIGPRGGMALPVWVEPLTLEDSHALLKPYPEFSVSQWGHYLAYTDPTFDWAVYSFTEFYSPKTFECVYDSRHPGPQAVAIYLLPQLTQKEITCWNLSTQKHSVFYPIPSYKDIYGFFHMTRDGIKVVGDVSVMVTRISKGYAKFQIYVKEIKIISVYVVWDDDLCCGMATQLNEILNLDAPIKGPLAIQVNHFRIAVDKVPKLGPPEEATYFGVKLSLIDKLIELLSYALMCSTDPKE